MRWFIFPLFLFIYTALFFLKNDPLNGVASPTSTITISFIDVGQGDSILIRESTGFDLLIDGGQTYAGPTVLEYLRSQSVDDIDVMLATHSHSDHIGGLIDVLDAVDIPVEAVYFNGYPGSTQTWTEFETAVTNEDLTLNPAQFPAQYSWGSMTAVILNPALGSDGSEQNDVSVVVLLVFGQNRLLFTSDINGAIETLILARGVPVTAELIKVAHHGSSFSSSSTFLAQVNPQNAVISVGDNSYGHPSPETLARLQAVGAITWRTDLGGTIVMNCDGIDCSMSNRIYLPVVLHDFP